MDEVESGGVGGGGLARVAVRIGGIAAALGIKAVGQALCEGGELLECGREFRNDEPVAREKVAHAATMAGMAFANAFLGVCHSMAHKLGAFHHIAHGVANALMLEQVIRFNSAEAPAKMGTFAQYDHPHTLARYAEIAQFLGFGGKDDAESVENLIKGVNDLKARVGIKATIADYGVSEEDFLATLDEMTEQAFDDQCTGANPRYPLFREIKQMYLNAYYGNNSETV